MLIQLQSTFFPAAAQSTWGAFLRRQPSDFRLVRRFLPDWPQPPPATRVLKQDAAAHPEYHGLVALVVCSTLLCLHEACAFDVCVCLSAIVKWTIAYVFFPSKLGFLRILMDRKIYFLNTPPDTLRLICIASCRADNDNDNGLMLTHTFADVMQFSPHMCSSHAQFLRNVIFIYHKFSFFIYFHLFDAITLSVLPMPLLLLRLV